jgi:hypothetical protein
MRCLSKWHASSIGSTIAAAPTCVQLQWFRHTAAVNAAQPRRPTCQPVQAIKKMRMLDKSTAEIDWQLTGQVAVFGVQVAVKTTLGMNQLTGRVTNLK